jgi:hypothetical protein
MDLPNNTYYSNGILINGDRQKINIKKENTELKLKIAKLEEELKNAYKYINELNSNKITISK